MVMKIFITSCGNAPPDGFIFHRLSYMPGTVAVDSPEACDVIVVAWTWQQVYEADSGLIQRMIDSKKPVIVFDYLECKKDHQIFMTRPHNWTEALMRYKPLVALENHITIYFKRELIREHVPALPYPVYPTDFIAHYDWNEPPDSPEAFAKRPIDIFMYWGYSSADRPMLHAELLRRRFSNLATELQDLDWLIAGGRTGICALLFIPHYRRVDFALLLKYQNKAKLSVCLRGASQKCFRHAESPINTVMALQECSTEFAFPWNSTNAVVLPNLPKPTINPTWYLDVNGAVQAMSAALNGDLYTVYRAGIENARHYFVSNYIQEYWLPLMRKHGAWP